MYFMLLWCSEFGAKRSPKVTLLGSRPNENGVVGLFCSGPPLGAPFEHRVAKIHSRSSKMSPKIVEHHRSVTSKSSTTFAKKTPEYGYQLLVKKSKQQFGGHSALYFMLCWCSDFRQSTRASRPQNILSKNNRYLSKMDWQCLAMPSQVVGIFLDVFPSSPIR